jgi:hypothetical protein
MQSKKKIVLNGRFLLLVALTFCIPVVLEIKVKQLKIKVLGQSKDIVKLHLRY